MSDPERWEHPIPGSDWRIVVEKHALGDGDFEAPNGFMRVLGKDDFEFWITLKYTGPVPF